jgi:glucose-6-phosphate isomerase
MVYKDQKDLGCALELTMKQRTIKNRRPDIRYLKDMKEVIYDQKWLKTANLDTELYYMYRSLKRKNGLRYDITVMPPKMLGKELVKTKGHYHSGPNQELYIVLNGKAIYLMQKEKNGKITDIYYVKAGKGDSVIIPVDYGHITVNPTNKELVMANWISQKEINSDYKSIVKKGGGGYFYTKKGWIKNIKHKNLPKLHYKLPRKSIPKNLGFLK